MEKIFNFFRFTNQNAFDTRKTLVLTIINGDGCVIKLQTFTNSTGAELISSALFEFSELSERDYRGHQILHVRTGNSINYNTSMEEAGVENNDEMFLSKRHNLPNKNTDFDRAPDQATIYEVTGYVENTVDKSFNFKRNFVKLAIGDHSYIRSFLMQMAIESAYIISTGPHADLLIHYFKQKIAGRRKYQNDAVETLTELGFDRSRCLYAIKLKKNIYSEALNWLIDYSEDSRAYRSYNSSMSLIKTISQNAEEKFLRLHQIIQIYGRTGQHYCEKLLKILSEMGFESEESMKALSACDWDPTGAVEILCDKQESTRCHNILAQNVLESAAVQGYLSDPEVFMTIMYLLGSGAGSSGIEHNWESSKLKYQHVASVLKRYNEEKHYNVLDNLNFN